MSLSTNLKLLLNMHQLTTAELARNTAIPQPIMHRLVNGHTPNPTVFTLSPIAKFFSLSIDQLIGEEPLPNKIEPSPSTLKFSPMVQEIPLISWKYPHKLENETKHYLLLNAKDSNHERYALSMDEYKYEILDKQFSKNTIIVIETSIKPINKDYILLHKKGSLFPELYRFLKEKNNIFVQSLHLDFSIRKILKVEKILGVVLQSNTDFLKKRKK